MMQRTRTYDRKRWLIPPADHRAEPLARVLGTSPITAQLLINRGVVEEVDARTFMRPNLRDLVEPLALTGMAAAADRIAHAVRSREPIVVYGDYDVDGITASSILWHALRAMGATVRTYIPHRIDEGYGINADAIRQLADEGTKLLISVDCGITAIEPVAVARERGMDVVITDHHEWKTLPDASGAGRMSLPEAAAVVHPRLPGEGPEYPNPHLCGAGVAFKVAWAVGQKLGAAGKVPESMRELLVEMTALAALGTIADVVPLVGENRILARFGLGGLKATKLHGLRALIRSAELDGQSIDSFHVGFLLAPRLNACGRMGHAGLAVEMLTEASPARADEIAKYLESQNRQRQTVEREILHEAIDQAEQLGLTREESPGIVLGSRGWHPGVIGIVASRIVDRFHKPTVMIAIDDHDHGHGSARSIRGFHLARALDACTHCLEKHGGHEMAAGLGIHASRLDEFRSAFIDHAQRTLTPEQLVPELRLDAVADLAHMSEGLINEMKRLEPFGQGNPKPLLACRGLTLTSEPRRVGRNGDHLQLFLRQGDRIIKAIAFNAASMLDRLKTGTPVDLAVEPQLNEWNGRVTVELTVKDIHIPT
jgi:single-stranded-DNA-specific exonuclease